MNVAERVKDVISRFNRRTGINNIYEFVSNSYDGMRDVSNQLQNNRTIKWGCGHALRCLNILLVVVSKAFQITDVVNDFLCVAKTLKNTTMVRASFELLLEDQVHKKSLLLFSPTRWISINIMATICFRFGHY